MSVNKKGPCLWTVSHARQKNMMFWSCVFVFVWLACHYLIGLLTGYQALYQEPGIMHVFRQFFMAAAGCLLSELFRWVLVSFLTKTPLRHWGAGILAALAPALLQILRLSGAQPGTLLSFSKIAGIVLPSLACSALLTAILFYGGLWPTLLYALATGALPALIPLTPAVNEGVTAMTNLVLPMIFLIILDCDADTEKKEKSSGPLAWAPFTALLLLLVAFFMGFLPWQPVAVATGSMEPDISVGDMVVYSRLEQAALQPGDVIAFRRDGQIIIHRIAELDRQDGRTVYITRGDANNANDEGYVLPDDVLGRVIFTVPGLGRLTLWLHAT